MKKIILVCIVFIGLYFLSTATYNLYKKNNLMKDEIAINIYFDIPNEEIDDFFSLDKGTYKSYEDVIFCSIPRSTETSNSSNSKINIYLEKEFDSINCLSKFNPQKDTKLNRKEFLTYSTITLSLYKRDLQYNSVLIKKKHIPINLTFGKLNNILLNKNGTINYCNK